MNRFAYAPLAVVVMSGVALAGPIHTWGYLIYTDIAPNPIVASGSGLLLTDVVRLGPLVKRPELYPVSLPDAASFYWDSYEHNTYSYLNTRFRDDASGTNTYGGIGWGVKREWQKVMGPNGLQWGEAVITDYPSGESSDYAGGRWVGDEFLWNRFDTKVARDGSVTLSVTPDVPNPRYVPEPGTISIVGIGAFGLLAAGWRKRFGKKHAMPVELPVQ